MKRLISCTMILMLLTMGAAPAPAQEKAPGDYIDVQSHWAQKNITTVCNLGLMSGMVVNEQGYKVFSPDSLVSRAQLAVVLQRIFELDYGNKRFVKPPLASDYYQDADKQTWYAEAATLAAINEVFDHNDNFCPQQAVTRIETARAIHHCVNAKGLNIPMIMLMPYYPDMEGLSQEDANALVFASNTGLMKGDGQYWRPYDKITRAELATVVSGLVRLLGVDESYNGQEYRMALGNSLTLMLDSNPTTGYSWTAAYDDKMLTLASKDYQQAGNGNLMGQGGKDIWRFKALQAGATELKMTYSRPWEPIPPGESVQPIKTFTLKVIITPSQAETGAIKVTNLVVKEKSDIMETDLNIPVVSGPLDSGVLSTINQRFEEDAMKLKQTLEAEVKDYAAECKAAGYPVRPYQLFTRYKQCSLNNDILSLYVDYYQFTGGAHGITNRQAYNIDLKTGKLLPLAELFKPGYDYKKVIDQEIRRQIALEPDSYFEGDMGFKGITNEQNYYLDSENLVVYFNQYEIAPYAAGIPEFKIKKQQCQSFFSR